MERPILSSALLSLLFSVFISLASSQKCHFPNGELVNSDTPCATNGTSHCCNSNDLCLTGGLCYTQSGVKGVTRGTCTDKSWTDPACPLNICPNFNKGVGVPIESCNGSPYSFICIGDPSQDCDDQATTISLGNDDGQLYLPLRESQYGSYLNKIEGRRCNSSNSKDSNDSSSGTNSAAIGVGVALAVVALVAIMSVIVLYRQVRRLRKTAKSAQVVANTENKNSLQYPPNYWGSPSSGTVGAVPLEQRMPAELHRQPIQEIDTHMSPRELDSRIQT